jgi:hypothetical protein
MKSAEHRAVGEAATAGALVQVGGDSAEDSFALSYGAVVALSGDFFTSRRCGVHGTEGTRAEPEDLASGDLFPLAAIPGEQGTKLGTWDEIICGSYQGRKAGPGPLLGPGHRER